MVQPRRRVSYIIPSPSESVPRLQLPPHGVSRLGATGPLLTPFAGQSGSSSKGSNHPRHRLGVASLALDTSTQLVARAAPEGILYSGGRDGLVMSWELGIPTKRRKVKQGTLKKPGQSRWETMTGWGDDVLEDILEDGDERVNDGDVLGDVTDNVAKRRRRAQSKAGEIPYEQEWEIDISSFPPGTVGDSSYYSSAIS
jgi:WD repeat-containing protein 48